MKRFRRIVVWPAWAASVAAAIAAPLPHVPPATIEGTIVEAKWSPAVHHKGRPGFSGSLGRDRTIPAHFDVDVIDYGGVDAATARRLNGFFGLSTTPDENRTAPPKRLRLMLNNDDPHALKKGMRIRVTDYQVTGDEGGTWSHHKKLELIVPLDSGQTKERRLE